MSGNIKVVVRCRPLNAREKARGATCLIRMDGNQTIITNNKAPSTNAIHQKKKHQTKDEDDNVKAFTFDRSYWSADKNDDQYADQELVYNDLGRELLDHAFDGYNCCIFAYGQTGSGKSYSMMGYGEDKGIIPRTCSELFERIADLTSDVLKFQVEVSYIEIYNEKVRDLLNPGNKGNLKVREHPTIGPYVEDLSRLVVNSFEDIDHLMSEGNKARTVAATNMNETSSRSHAVFTLFLTSNRFEQVANLNTEKAARISLVDLAGSERANSTGATGARLKEGANINKSLTTLGKVIAALAEQSSQPNHKKSSSAHIPYRDSVLTWLLKDSLGGNSKTAMIAAISPADYDETLSTLRYADQAKRIKNKAVVNEDPNARLIRELKEELQALRDTLMIYAPEEVEKITLQKKSSGRGSSASRASSRATTRATTASPMLLISPESPLVKQRGNSLLTKEQVIDQLQSSEKLLSQVNQTWEEKMSATEAIHKEREKALEELGVIVEKNNIGVYAPKSIHLINLNEDPLMTECLMYQIKPGITRVGRLGSAVPADIRLSGSEILDEHCYFENISVPAAATEDAPLQQQDDEEEEENMASRVVTIHPGKESVTLVNGMRILQPKVLHSGYRIIFGSGLHHLFRFNNPDEVRREREHMQQFGMSPKINTGIFPMMERGDSALGHTLSPASTTTAMTDLTAASASHHHPPADIVDWNFAHSEALRKFGGPRSADLTIMTDEDLKQLSDGITKVREFRNRKRISSDSHNLLFEDPDSIITTTTVSPRTSISSSSNKRFSAISSVPTIFTEEESHADNPDPDDEPHTAAKELLSSIMSKEEKDHLIRIATEEMQQQLELQKQEYEEKLKLVESSNMKADELNRERDELAAKYAQVKQDMEKVLEQQKLAYESKIKRISAHLPPGTALSSDNLLVGYTAKNAAESLMRMTIEKWRQLRYVKMAEDCLIHAVVLKEANIMAKELGKNVVYQFIVVHDDISSNPLSFWESTSALQPFLREPDTHLIKEAKPCLAVQVIDHVHRATYIWSIAKVKHRLRRMRRLYDYTDRPLFTGQHFNREDPFYETPCPRFSLIGLARIPLRNLTLQLHADNYVDIYCRNTGKIMGQIRVLITPIARSVSRKHQHQTNGGEGPAQRPSLFYHKRSSSSNVLQDQKQVLGEKYLLHIGQQQVFEIRIQELKGVSESNFTQVHAQFRLSSFGNVERYSTADKIYQTDPISNFGTETVQFNQCQTLSVNITENMMDVILNQGLTIEVYGQAQENYLFGLVEHVSNASGVNSRNGSPTTPTSEQSELFAKAVTSELGNSGNVPASRRFSIDRRFSVEQSTYDGILMEEKHDVLVWIQICELNDDGEYAPVKVLHTEVNDHQHHNHHVKHHQDVFCLRQGLQRRIALTLSHDSGKQFEWLSIKQAKIGNVRLVDNKGRQTDSPPHPPVEIHLFPDQQETTFERNGKSRMTAQGPWDSSLHDSLFLNRVTASGQRVRLRLSWQIECDKCVAPLNFEMDISVQIQARDATISTSASSSSMFRQFLLGGGDSDANGRVSKIMYKTSGLFIVQLKPPMTRQVRELWRLNTANKYVRGEEFIGSWKPRGVSLITDYRAARQRMLHQESVAAFRHSLVLAGHPQTKAFQRSQSDHALTLQCLTNSHMTDTASTSESISNDKQKTEPEALTRKVIELWQTQFGTREEIVFSQDPPKITSLTSSSSTNSISSVKSLSKKYSKIKLTPDIQQLHPSDTITKKGFLLHPENVDDVWLKHWFVLRRPFIIIYQDQTEVEEIGVFNLSSARVDYKSDLEDMLQRKYTFAIYTHNNAYLLQANDFEDMKEWISKIDQFYPVKKLENLS
ncbi:Telomerase reverse transcriptase [Mucor velutinosus]|uniref:Telomerase reverse transcriptase n=1 Tax=Mucor velutinosus TaxID=708070 RepID=A0AAN7DE17_9FUNG|nr:Telomerase reverse transcriptase [Mucor velutinosus]